MSKKQIEPYKLEPHHFGGWKKIPYQICYKCGLIAYRNPFTEWAIKQGCNHKDHPSYAQKRLQFTELFK